eukprot:CAMPEP_0181182970 /NCGR_PEP_ID=MMETSP1096-20121128/8169_1 /TAXON_ID=156174 ORGANISM="Chrysochromulina ericina, Strain CCMP281" /NCGR_SAMPLE_ID=MMETSP1096 /ASSEMBLY_ACC=CAM_ASM_000453 /LENGTH=68 /DNA_ID=CAMNT_0023271605 /DNA_START=255 /DNA_END=461 /DNA_ORIENTATION=-
MNGAADRATWGGRSYYMWRQIVLHGAADRSMQRRRYALTLLRCKRGGQPSKAKKRYASLMADQPVKRK